MREEFIFKLAADVEPEDLIQIPPSGKSGKTNGKTPQPSNGGFTAPCREQILKSFCQRTLEEGKDLGLDARTIPDIGIN